MNNFLKNNREPAISCPICKEMLFFKHDIKINHHNMNNPFDCDFMILDLKYSNNICIEFSIDNYNIQNFVNKINYYESFVIIKIENDDEEVKYIRSGLISWEMHDLNIVRQQILTLLSFQ